MLQANGRNNTTLDQPIFKVKRVYEKYRSSLTSIEMLQSIQQMTSKQVSGQCQNQQQQRVQMPCLALSAALICVSLELSKAEL
jgi:hypothetical protein